MSTDQILSSKSNGIGTLTFNNPERRNAISLDMSLAAADVMDDFAADPAVRVIVLTGAGDKAFVSGADISRFEKERANPEQVAAYNEKSQRFRDGLRQIGKPTIAKIRGYCLGGGLSIALNCDLRICAQGSQFGIPAAKLGIGYGAEGLSQLVSLVGPSAAKEILYTARRYSAEEALRLGLVNQLVSGSELDEYVDKYAATIAGNAPLSIIATKRVVDELVKDREERNVALCEQVVRDCFASRDYTEGRRAFMEKRKAVFVGR
jgi:enoyl-CoA hydratase/carnithine racemase